MKRIIASAVIVCALLSGCTGDGSGDDSTSYASKTSTVHYVCIGMENSARFGECPGCKKDSDSIHNLLKGQYGYPGVLLQSSGATREAVVKSISEAIKLTPEDGLFILYYSGHGGREYLNSWNTEEPEGADQEDEYLCLYDSYLLDDEIWKLITQCRGRVFLCFDACHSQTMYRAVADELTLLSGKAIPLSSGKVKSRGFRLRPRAVALSDGGFRMLCWSGCLEAEYSYGSKSGGMLTNAILAQWKKGMSYDELWKKASKVVEDVGMQHPYSTLYGTGFGEVFR